MNQPKSQLSFQVLKIIWGALLMTQLFYIVILHFILKPMNDMPVETQWIPNFNNPFELVMYLAPIGMIIISYLAPAAMARTALRNNLNQVEYHAEGRVHPAIFTAFIVRLALLESICIQGFTLAFIKRMPNLILPFFAVSFLLFLKNSPTNPKKVEEDLVG